MKVLLISTAAFGLRTSFPPWLSTFRFPRCRFCLPAAGLALALAAARAEDTNAFASPTEIKRMSLEELMSLEVASVSKQPEKWFETPSAIQVITGEDIRRSGASSLPEALRLASNLQVAQMDSRNWAISARGFNNGLANKLQVVM